MVKVVLVLNVVLVVQNVVAVCGVLVVRFV